MSRHPNTDFAQCLSIRAKSTSLLSRKAPNATPVVLTLGGLHRNEVQQRQHNVLKKPGIRTIHFSQKITVKYRCCKRFCNAATFEEQNTKDNNTVTFTASDRPPDGLVSEVTQGDSSRTPAPQRGIDTLSANHSDKEIRPEASAKANIQTPSLFVHSADIIHHAPDVLLGLKTVGTNPTQIEDNGQVLCITASFLPPGKREESVT